MVYLVVVHIWRYQAASRVRSAPSTIDDDVSLDAQLVPLTPDAGHGQRRDPPPRPERPVRMHTVHPVLGPALVGIAGLVLVGIDVGTLVYVSVDTGANQVRSIEPGPFALYGGLGLAALTAAVIWFFVGAHDEPVLPTATLTTDTFVLGLSGRL